MNSSDDGWREVASLLLILTDEAEELVLLAGGSWGGGLGKRRTFLNLPPEQL